jgi:hypothetical protein
MRHLISGLVAAVAVMAAAPAMACGYSSCAPVAYAAPVVAYTSSGCNPCGGVGWGYDRLADPVEQYYYVNQGPTYSGPGAWAPAPVYREGTVSGYRPFYGYNRSHYGYRSYRPWAPRVSYYHHRRVHHHHGYAPRHAYAPRYAPYRHGAPMLRRYY